MKEFDVIVIGAGAAGLMAASVAGKRNRKVLLLEHTSKVGEKIRISGGGRCNFTNLYASPKNYISNNLHFVISSLARYTQHDFINLVEKYGIAYHEKTLGQLFCDGPSTQIINMLLSECEKAQVTILTNCTILNILKNDRFRILTDNGELVAKSVVIATGGLSIPKLGATDFGYRIAKQFGLSIITPKPALVPLVVDSNIINNLSGISILSIVNNRYASFRENILFTHRGLSGPAILQISSYIENFSSEILTINLLPDIDLNTIFLQEKSTKVILSNVLKNYLPKRFVDCVYPNSKRLLDYKLKELQDIANSLHNFQIIITGNEGYLKAEVTRGGVDTKELSSKTMESIKVPGLYFVGEVVDVTGWLGGYNFQWAWSSGNAAGQYA